MAIITFGEFCEKRGIHHFKEAFFHYLKIAGVGRALPEEELDRHWTAFLDNAVCMGNEKGGKKKKWK